MIERVVIWFSAGVTSAIAAKITVNKYKELFPVHLVMCDTGSEHDDNFRFANEVASWVALPLEIIKSEKYTNTLDVYRKTKYLVGVAGARCTLELKKTPRRQYERLETDLQIFGYDYSEKARAIRFQENNPEVNSWFPLIENQITKSDARQILAKAKILEPVTYSMGFNNANCLKTGCVKGGMGYWNHIRRINPDAFWQMADVERELGHAICSTEAQSKDGKRVKVPVYLDELSPTAGDHKSEPAFQCGLFCGEY